MALRENDVEIRRPCPVKLDPARAQGGTKSWYCGHCEKSVHVLSNMTESEARDFLGARVGEDLCVTYAVRQDGSIRFRAEPAASLVPVASLTRRRAAIAAAGLGLALAACAPHDNPDVRRGIDVADVPAMQQRTTTIPDQRTEPNHDRMVDGRIALEPEERIVEGGIKLEPDERMVDGGVEPMPMKPGGITVAPLPPTTADEPCDKPPTAAADKMVRGGSG